jgi:hypothetical protein
MTDTRFASYEEKFGDQSWELDALDPKIIDGLVSNAIEEYIDFDQWEVIKAKETKAREKIAAVAREWEDEE